MTDTCPLAWQHNLRTRFNKQRVVSTHFSTVVSGVFYCCSCCCFGSQCPVLFFFFFFKICPTVQWRHTALVWAVSQHTSISKNSEAIGCVTTHWHQQEQDVSQNTDISKNSKAIGCVTTHWHQQKQAVTTHWHQQKQAVSQHTGISKNRMCHNTLTSAKTARP